MGDENLMFNRNRSTGDLVPLVHDARVRKSIIEIQSSSFHFPNTRAPTNANLRVILLLCSPSDHAFIALIYIVILYALMMI